MAIDAVKIITEQLGACSKAGQAVAADEQCRQAYLKAHHLLTELLALAELLRGTRVENVFRLGVKEYQFSVIASCLGFYRQSFGALRLALELCLAALDFSMNERRLRSWLRGESDIVWQALVNEENGVFAKAVIRVFCEDLADLAQQHRVMTEKVYRECSEYVHGNISTHKSLPEGIEFARDVFLAWTNKASVVRLSILFAFVARYVDDLDEKQKDTIRPIVLDALGHVEVVRVKFGGPAKG